MDMTRQYFIISLLLIFVMENADGTNNSIIKTNDTDSIVIEYYPIPSPDEIMSYIDRNSLIFKPKILNKRENVNIYNTSYEKRLGVGIYMANVAYALSFEQTGTALSYFEIVEKLGREINVFSQEIGDIAQRFVNNVHHQDSLKNLYTESYILMFEHVEYTSNMNSYVIISAASFIESLYLALNSIELRNQDNEFIERVLGQRIVLDHILKAAEFYLDKNQKDRLFFELSGVKKAFDTHNPTYQPISKQVKNDGTIVLGYNKLWHGSELGSIIELKNEINLLRKIWAKE